MDDLPSHEREAARPLYLEGFTNEGIAERVRALEETVKRHLHTARHDMRRSVAEEV